MNWTTPPPDWLKINVDAAIDEGGFVCVSAIARDSLGCVKGARGKPFAGIISSQIGECLALRGGVELGRILRAQRIMLESDCKTVLGTLRRWRPDLCVSVVGYCMMPIGVFTTVGLFFEEKGTVAGFVVAGACVASLKISKFEERLSKGLGGENAYHVAGYRYLLLDGDRSVSRASPQRLGVNRFAIWVSVVVLWIRVSVVVLCEGEIRRGGDQRLGIGGLGLGLEIRCD
ncbi:hypothetical protein Droror1_Dr00008644 [Drosera rotundifolia]